MRPFVIRAASFGRSSVHLRIREGHGELIGYVAAIPGGFEATVNDARRGASQPVWREIPGGPFPTRTAAAQALFDSETEPA